ncbi:MAG TPA: DUF5654 family protein [Candidatus Nanoarchaeia archaeon]|nr:DUF5654 family protein [Candidatus Nanoarchaeia archaeon]
MARKSKAKIVEKVKESALKFRMELKKSVLTGVVAAFGFLIAFVWRDVVVEYVNNITKISPVQGRFVSALIITIISVLGILIFTKLLGGGK